MRVAVIGTGYVGLVAGACLAEMGNEVICVDIDEERIERLKNGEVPIYEPGLVELVQRNIAKNRLSFTTDTVEAVSQSLVIFMAVQTPMDENGSADLKHLLDAARTVAKGINGYKVIVDKSTVPVGTALQVKEVISQNTEYKCDVVSNPEFLKEGAAVDDFMKPDRVIIGCDSERAEAIIKDLYEPFVRTGNPLISMCIESAELTKYAANAFLATKVSFINEIARLCELVGADISEVRQGIGADKRIGPAFLHSGIGFGGSCFPKDLRALLHTAKSRGMALQVVEAAVEANERQKHFMPDKIRKHFAGKLKGLRFAMWGLAFKANTDDMRESPALEIINFLLKEKVSIRVYDPEAMDNALRMFGDILVYAQDVYDALDGADALVVATEWNEFRRPDFDEMLKLMKSPVIFDGRNLFNPNKMRERGFQYYGVGRI